MRIHNLIKLLKKNYGIFQMNKKANKKIEKRKIYIAKTVTYITVSDNTEEWNISHEVAQYSENTKKIS